MADNNPDVDYEGSEPKVWTVAQEQREVDPDAEYAKMELPHDGTLCQKMMSWDRYMGILRVHRAQGPEILALKLQDMYIWLGFSPEAVKLLIREIGLDSPERPRALTNKNVNDICNVMRKLGGKNADGMPNRGQQVSLIVHENLKLAIFLLHHRWRCTLDWEITGVNEETKHLLAGQKKLKDKYRDLDVLPMINKSDMVGTMEAIKEYFRSHHGAIWAPLAYINRKTMTVQTYGDYPTYATLDDNMIARMLHLPSKKKQVSY